MSVSHIAAFRAQADFAPESKIKVGASVWSDGVAGDRLYKLVLSKKPSTVQKALDLASELKELPFTVKQVQGHLKWMYTAGELEVDGKSYVVQTKPKATKPEPKVEPKTKTKIETKAEPRTAASTKRVLVRTKKPKAT
jgi:hypothetical protein